MQKQLQMGGLVAEMWANTNKGGRQASDWAELGELDRCQATDKKHNRTNSWATSKENGKAVGRVGTCGGRGQQGDSLSFQVSSLEAEARPESPLIRHWRWRVGVEGARRGSEACECAGEPHPAPACSPSSPGLLLSSLGPLCSSLVLPPRVNKPIRRAELTVGSRNARCSQCGHTLERGAKTSTLSSLPVFKVLK